MNTITSENYTAEEFHYGLSGRYFMIKEGEKAVGVIVVYPNNDGGHAFQCYDAEMENSLPANIWWLMALQVIEPELVKD